MGKGGSIPLWKPLLPLRVEIRILTLRPIVTNLALPTRVSEHVVVLSEVLSTICSIGSKILVVVNLFVQLENY